MNTFVSLGDLISVNKKLSFLSMALKLFSCKPLMPKNPIKRIEIVYKYLILFRLNISSNEHLLRSDGDVALRVADSNYKVINIKDRVIHTIFEEENEDKIYSSLKHKDSSSVYEKICNIDKENRIITGVFYNGHHPNLNKTKSKILKKRLRDMFINLLVKSDIKYVNADLYSKSLVANILTTLERNSKNIMEEESDLVRNFAIETHQRFIKNFHDEFLLLTLSHGDIKQDNLLVENNKIILIDWEFCEFRSPTYDIMKFKSRFPEFEDKFYLHVNKCLSENLSSKTKTKKHSKLTHRDMDSQLDIYYLEDISLRLLQFENREFAKDFSKIVKFVSRTMQVNQKGNVV
ncbi:phosphotransferase [Virgibacillus byunsanensis]|uniref:Phosphotransferase n=1 Tax=Virgibacillus byunsanensis TaxID=570945 RepID=A0ABW3LT46_9BACI